MSQKAATWKLAVFSQDRRLEYLSLAQASFGLLQCFSACEVQTRLSEPGVKSNARCPLHPPSLAGERLKKRQRWVPSPAPQGVFCDTMLASKTWWQHSALNTLVLQARLATAGMHRAMAQAVNELAQNLNNRGCAGFGPCFHLPGFRLGIPAF